MKRIALPGLLLFFVVLLGANGLAAQEQTELSLARMLHRSPCKVFIGVGTSEKDGQIKVDYTVDGSPAETFGVQAGDIILALDNAPVNSQKSLISERNKHQPGDNFTLTILRDGQQTDIQAKFDECDEAASVESARQWDAFERQMEALDLQLERMAESFADHNMVQVKSRPILGIYPSDEEADGVVVSGLVRGKGAEAAGIQPGDLLLKVDGRTVNAQNPISQALRGHEAGDVVFVVLRRRSQEIELPVTLTASGFHFITTERDPCDVFIGVYSTEHEKGRRVTGVIGGTAAEDCGIQPGDIITAFDGQPIGSHQELVAARDRRQPGDSFTLGILRDEIPMELSARFKECPNDQPAIREEEEVVELAEELQTAEDRTPAPETELQLVELQAFPNPTTGPLNISFEAEPVPTTVRITDASGKVLYDRTLNQFNGFFSERIDLFGKTPGLLTLTVQQGGKYYAKGIVLMPRA